MKKTVTSVDIFGKTYEVPVSDLTWRPSAYGIVIQAQKILLVPQFGENSYDLPGGGVDLGEILEDAAVREVKEETGLDVANPQLVDATSNFFTFTHAEKNTAACILVYYQCDLVGGTISTAGFDEFEKEYARQAVWFPIAQLDTIKVASSHDWREVVKKVV